MKIILVKGLEKSCVSLLSLDHSVTNYPTFQQLIQRLTSHSSSMLPTALLCVSSSLWDLGFSMAHALLTVKGREQWQDHATAPKTSACETFITSVHTLVANVRHRAKPDVSGACRELQGGAWREGHQIF